MSEIAETELRELRDKLNDALRMACMMDEFDTVVALLGVGADPRADDARALKSAVMSVGSGLDPIMRCTTYMLVQHFCDEDAKDVLLTTYALAKKMLSKNGEKAAKLIMDHVDFCVRKKGWDAGVLDVMKDYTYVLSADTGLK